MVFSFKKSKTPEECPDDVEICSQTFLNVSTAGGEQNSVWAAAHNTEMESTAKTTLASKRLVAF